jgi:hypothetical protein
MYSEMQEGFKEVMSDLNGLKGDFKSLKSDGSDLNAGYTKIDIILEKLEKKLHL